MAEGVRIFNRPYSRLPGAVKSIYFLLGLDGMRKPMARVCEGLLSRWMS